MSHTLESWNERFNHWVGHMNTRRMLLLEAVVDLNDHCPNLTRLRQIEADARAANLIGPDGKIRGLYIDTRCRLPLLGDGLLFVNASHVWYRVAGHPIAETCVEDVGPVWTKQGWVFRFDDYDLPLIQCYSTPEAAEAAKENK